MMTVDVSIDPTLDVPPATLWKEAASGSGHALAILGHEIFKASTAGCIGLAEGLAAAEMMLRLAQAVGGPSERAALIIALDTRARFLQPDAPELSAILMIEVHRLLQLAANDGDEGAAEALADWQHAPSIPNAFAIEHFAVQAAASGDEDALMALGRAFMQAFFDSGSINSPALAQAEVLYRLAAAHGDCAAIGALADNLVRRGQYEAERDGPAEVALSEAADLVVMLAKADPLRFGSWLGEYAEHAGVDRLAPALKEDPSLLVHLLPGGAC